MVTHGQTRFGNVRALHFIGVGGIGMSGIAQVCAARGVRVTGSDRSHDRAQREAFFQSLQAHRVALMPQDGSGPALKPDAVVASTAIEDSNPDLRAAQQAGVPVVHRSEVLAHFVRSSRSVAVTGTSGKTTVTAMVGWMLHCAGLQPSIVNGGIMNNFAAEHPPGNTVVGPGEFLCAEADESDGSVVRFFPEIGVVTTISKDHHEVPELVELFKRFVSQVRSTVVVNADYPALAALASQAPRAVTYGRRRDAHVRLTAVRASAGGVQFRAGGRAFDLRVPGEHNAANAAAAIAVGMSLGLDMDTVADALATFTGVHRRLEVVARVGEVWVVDDYAHNPEKIAASLRAMRGRGERTIAIFQPHGFGPTRFMRDELVDAFAAELRPGDALFLPDVYDAGGTADRSISSADLVRELTDRGIDARHAADREQLVHDVVDAAGDRAVVLTMGARDDTLTGLCEAIARAVRERGPRSQAVCVP